MNSLSLRQALRTFGLLAVAVALFLSAVFPIAWSAAGSLGVTLVLVGALGTEIFAQFIPGPSWQKLLASLAVALLMALSLAVVATFGVRLHTELTWELVALLGLAIAAGLITVFIALLIGGLIPPRNVRRWLSYMPIAGWLGFLPGTLTWGAIAVLGTDVSARLEGTIAAGLIVGLVAGAMGGFIMPPDAGYRLRDGLVFSAIVAPFAGLTGGLLLGLAVGTGTGATAGVLVGLASGGAAAVGHAVGAMLLPGLSVFDDLWDYLRPMGVPVLAFALGYFFITYWFASLYTVAHRAAPRDAFTVNQPATSPNESQIDDSFGVFLYFSIMTISTLGYSELNPNSAQTKFLAAAQSVAGTGWLVIVFAAVIAYLEPRFQEVRRHHQERTKLAHLDGNTDEQSAIRNARIPEPDETRASATPL